MGSDTEKLSVGDILSNGSCVIQVTQVNFQRETWTWCRVCRSAHEIDAQLFESGLGPWKRRVNVRQ